MLRTPRALVLGGLVTAASFSTACKGGGAKEQVKAEYKQTLPNVLDMVGENPDGYMAMRDMGPFMDLMREGKILIDGPVDNLLTMVEESGEHVEREDFEKFRAKYGQLMTALEGSGIKWDHGMVINGKKGNDGVVLFQAESLEKLEPILTAVDQPPTKVKEHCAKLDADPEWIACGETADKAKAYKPAKKGSELVAALEHNLPGVDFKAVNMAFDFDEASMVMLTDPGIYHLAMHVKKDLPPEFSKVAGRGPAKALRLVKPGDTFLWGRIDMGAAKAQAGGVPKPAQAMVDAFDGEFLMAGTSDPAGFVVQAGVTDPYPVRSVLDLGWTQKDNLPKEIPNAPGLTYEFKAEEISVGDEKFRVLSAIFDSPEIKKYEGLWKPAVSAWVGGGYLSVGAGMGIDEAKKVANASGEGPSEELLASLPPGLAEELKAQEVNFAYHASFDALQSPALMDELEKNWGSIDLPDKPSFDALEGVMQLFAPISELSAWVSRSNTSPVFHVSVRMFGDPRTEEGKAALAAINSVAGGTSRADAYGGLAKKYGASHRAHAYEVRASKDMKDASVAGLSVVGIAAAVAIPAFTKYQRRAREGAAMMEEMREAEMRALERNDEALEAAGVLPQKPLVPEGEPVPPIP